ncbi:MULTISPECIES: hypothetical protein [Planktothricoides]|uniref:Uncharacterized protein n=1 Tax=Planktothricoides raciborskii FACHB-1370 TaxID=2949576 RepID=A0ABR8EHB7_9CYAN|nr:MULTISPECIES: hypothetical protein [Planktothricoides]MBD2545842.1 hypothetical protein [Planktothricoides raciborskii FACHB-1370]MBD2584100.1 hypothetical protein [Planktothricoides raciborskii FACHB-1261]
MIYWLFGYLVKISNQQPHTTQTSDVTQRISRTGVDRRSDNPINFPAAPPRM